MEQTVMVNSEQELLDFEYNYKSLGWEVIAHADPEKYIKRMIAYRKKSDDPFEEEYIECEWIMHGEVQTQKIICNSLDEFSNYLRDNSTKDSFQPANEPKNLRVGFVILDQDKKIATQYLLRISKLKDETANPDNVELAKKLFFV